MIGSFYLIAWVTVPDERFECIFATMRRVFALPMTDKQRIDKKLSPHSRCRSARGGRMFPGSSRLSCHVLQYALQYTVRTILGIVRTPYYSTPKRYVLWYIVHVQYTMVYCTRILQCVCCRETELKQNSREKCEIKFNNWLVEYLCVIIMLFGNQNILISTITASHLDLLFTWQCLNNAN